MQTQVQQVTADPCRGLVPGGDVRKGSVERDVEAAQHVEIDGGEVVPLGVVERRKVGHEAPEHPELRIDTTAVQPDAAAIR